MDSILNLDPTPSPEAFSQNLPQVKDSANLVSNSVLRLKNFSEHFLYDADLFNFNLVVLHVLKVRENLIFQLVCVLIFSQKKLI